MSAENIITIFSAMAFGPAVAVVLLRWVLNRAILQDKRIEEQAAELGTLRARLDELEGQGRETMLRRIEDSVAEEGRLIKAIEAITSQAARLADVVTALEQRLLGRTCQLPTEVLAKVHEWMRQRSTEH